MRSFFATVGVILTTFVAAGCVPPASRYYSSASKSSSAAEISGSPMPARVSIAETISNIPEEKFAMPLKGAVRLLSPFGKRGAKTHTGADLRSGKGKGEGEPVLASRAGRVMSVGWVRGYGQQALIEHGDGYKTRYAHMKSINVTLGERVEQGQQIGRVGSTGHASAPHLHFEIITPKGQFIDPALFLPVGDVKK